MRVAQDGGSVPVSWLLCRSRLVSLLSSPIDGGKVPVSLEPGTASCVTYPLTEHVTPFHVETSLVVFQFILAAGCHAGPDVAEYRSLRTCRLSAVSQSDPETRQEGSSTKSNRDKTTDLLLCSVAAWRRELMMQSTIFYCTIQDTVYCTVET